MNRAGITGGILAAIAFALYTILSEYGMRTYSSWTVLFFALLFASIHASITATIEPITAAVIAYIFLDESMGPLQLLGGAMVIAAIILLQRK
jgi:drug/metabolite transporter (DMT)-like permease